MATRSLFRIHRPQSPETNSFHDDFPFSHLPNMSRSESPRSEKLFVPRNYTAQRQTTAEIMNRNSMLFHEMNEQNKKSIFFCLGEG